MEQPVISVIIPVYNTEKYLQRCIDALVGQTFPHIELLFIDDGSKDGSLKILDAAAKKDRRVRVFQQKNAGPSAARNRGLRHAEGEYIMFCDSDDTVEPEWCEEMLGMIREHPNAWNICGVVFRNEAGEAVASYGSQDAIQIDTDHYWWTFANGLSAQTWNKIYSAEILRSNQIQFDEELRRGEDVLFNLAYFSRANSIVVSDKKLYNYYQYQSMETLTGAYHKCDFEVAQMLYRARKPYISERDMESFQRHYWHILSNVLEDTLTKDKEDSLAGRIRLNQRSIETMDYQELLHLFGREEMHPLAYQCLAKKWYFGYWLIQKGSAIKQRKARKG